MFISLEYTSIIKHVIPTDEWWDRLYIYFETPSFLNMGVLKLGIPRDIFSAEHIQFQTKTRRFR